VPLKVDHSFGEDVGLKITEWPRMPFNMMMAHVAEKPVPICIQICEPICAESKYKIGINLLGQPFAEIALSGITRLFNCRSEKEEATHTEERKLQPPL